MLINSAVLDSFGRILDAGSMRHAVISNNIANVDTPNFKRSEVHFEQLLQKELQSYKSSFVGRRTDPRHLYIGASGPEPVFAQVKLDGQRSMNNNHNNVDIDYEMAQLAKNQLYYNAIVNQLNHEIRMTRTAIDGRR